MSQKSFTVRSDLRLADPMPEEPAWSHLHRICLINNTTLVRLMECQHATFGSLLLRDRRFHGALSKFLTRTWGFQQYVDRHTLMSVLIQPAGRSDEETRRDVETFFFTVHGPVVPTGRIHTCERCQAEDEASYGFWWFRRVHQLAGVFRCPMHDQALSARWLDLNGPKYFISEYEPGDKVAQRERRAAERDSRLVRTYSTILIWVFDGDPVSRASIVKAAFDYAFPFPFLARERVREMVRYGGNQEWVDTCLPGLSHGWENARASLYHHALALAVSGQSAAELELELDERERALHGAAELIAEDFSELEGPRR